VRRPKGKGSKGGIEGMIPMLITIHIKKIKAFAKRNTGVPLYEVKSSDIFVAKDLDLSDFASKDLKNCLLLS
jgi:hypothetical protein